MHKNSSLPLPFPLESGKPRTWHPNQGGRPGLKDSSVWLFSPPGHSVLSQQTKTGHSGSGSWHPGTRMPLGCQGGYWPKGQSLWSPTRSLLSQATAGMPWGLGLASHPEHCQRSANGSQKGGPQPLGVVSLRQSHWGAFHSLSRVCACAFLLWDPSAGPWTLKGPWLFRK